MTALQAPAAETPPRDVGEAFLTGAVRLRRGSGCSQRSRPTCGPRLSCATPSARGNRRRGVPTALRGPVSGRLPGELTQHQVEPRRHDHPTRTVWEAGSGSPAVDLALAGVVLGHGHRACRSHASITSALPLSDAVHSSRPTACARSTSGSRAHSLCRAPEISELLPELLPAPLRPAVPADDEGPATHVTAGHGPFAVLPSAEDGGFEPPRVLPQHAFQACAIGH